LSQQTLPVPAALSPMRPRIYRTNTMMGGNTNLSSSPFDIVSTAAVSHQQNPGYHFQHFQHFGKC
jgi:hypothetical protein